MATHSGLTPTSSPPLPPPCPTPFTRHILTLSHLHHYHHPPLSPLHAPSVLTVRPDTYFI